MKKIIRLTESDLTKIVKQIIIETKNSTSKSEILKMSDNELEDLKVKGEISWQKG
jgi:hypothetical protein